MKLFLVALCVALAAAEPEADADAQYLLRSPYAATYGAGIYGAYKPFTTYNAGLYQPSYINRAFGYYKRDADADADAQFITPYTNLYNQQRYITPSVYSAYKPYTTYNAGLYQPSYINRAFGYYKRDADADADSQFLTTSPYHSTYLNAGLRYPAFNQYSTYSNIYNPYAIAKPFGYYKRDAEADSDAQFINPYTNLYQNNYYNRFATPTVYNRYNAYSNVYSPFTTVAKPFGYYKRDAEADSAVVYKQGNFHTNLHNLQKGVHNQYTAQYQPSQLYNSATPFVQQPVGYSAYQYQPSVYQPYSGLYHY